MLIALAAALAAAAPAATDPTDNKADPDAIICKSVVKTGTRLSSRLCHTRGEWEAIERRSQDSIKDTVDRPLIETRRGG